MSMSSKSFKSSTFVRSLWLVTALWMPVSGLAADETGGLQSRVESVRKLIEESSAAKQVLESENENALSMRRRASELYSAAVKALDVGDIQTAEAALSEALNLMFQAVAAVNSTNGATDKQVRDYRKRHDSLDALLIAHQRIATEKGRDKAHEELRLSIASDIEAAGKMHENESIMDARVHLDAAYEKVRHGLEDLRDGDTLIRELKFETSEDEYIYELDRNDTHRMLISVLLSEKLEDENVHRKTQPYLNKADSLRKQAEERANAGSFGEAIQLLENSTGEVVKAIRSAGVYIPG